MFSTSISVTRAAVILLTLTVPGQSLVFAEAFRIIHAFDNASGAAVPFSSIIKQDGWLYGTTAVTNYGSSKTYPPELRVDGGAVFKLRLDGTGFQVIKQFATSEPTSGYGPFQGLTVAGDALVGTLMYAGSNSGGTLYSVGMDGSNFRVLHDFGGTGDGTHAYAAPILVGSVLYGLTAFGGANPGGGEGAFLGAGALYSYNLTTSTYRVERDFSSPGATAFGTLTQVGDWLYGMVSDHRNPAEYGQVFRYRPSDQAYDVIHEFTGGHGGGYPYDSLVFDGGHYLYGTTLGYYPFLPLSPSEIAAIQDEGVIFRIDLARALSDPLQYQVLHDFSLAIGDGAKPNSSMLVAPDGFLYGISHGSESFGGTFNGVRYGTEFGTFYRLHPDGSDFSVLHTFDSVENGFTPMRGLVWDNGTIYGTTAEGGTSINLGSGLTSRGSGTVWSYEVYPVPEPSTLLILAGGGMMVWLFRPRCSERIC
jgi:PEP-CTERM motif